MGMIFGLHSASVKPPFSEYTRPALGKTSWSCRSSAVRQLREDQRLAPRAQRELTLASAMMIHSARATVRPRLLSAIGRDIVTRRCIAPPLLPLIYAALSPNAPASARLQSLAALLWQTSRPWTRNALAAHSQSPSSCTMYTVVASAAKCAN
jgi:hypothetical protein